MTLLESLSVALSGVALGLVLSSLIRSARRRQALARSFAVAEPECYSRLPPPLAINLDTGEHSTLFCELLPPADA